MRAGFTFAASALGLLVDGRQVALAAIPVTIGGGYAALAEGIPIWAVVAASMVVAFAIAVLLTRLERSRERRLVRELRKEWRADLVAVAEAVDAGFHAHSIQRAAMFDLIAEEGQRQIDAVQAIEASRKQYLDAAAALRKRLQSRDA